LRFFIKPVLSITILLLFSLPANATSVSCVYDKDVVFVICNNAATPTSHNNNSRIASNFFIDLIAAFDSRVGFIFNSETIEEQHDLTDLISFRRDIKDKIANAPTPKGGVNVLLGFEVAVEMLASAVDTARTPVIILINDSYFEEYEATLAEALTYAEDLGISVFSVKSGATLKIMLEQMRDIFITLVESGAQPLQSHTLTGNPQEIILNIENNSMYIISYIVFSDYPIQDVLLHYENDKYKVSSDRAGNYSVVTVFNPTAGDLILSLTGVYDDTANIYALPIYDLSLILGLPKTTVDNAEFLWFLQDSTGTNIYDPLLVNTIEPTLHIKCTTTNETYEIPLPRGNTNEIINLKSGSYEAFLINTGYNFPRISNSQSFYVPDTLPAPRITATAGVNRFLLFTVFQREVFIPLSDVILYEQENLPLKITLVSGSGGIVNHSYDSSDENNGYITLTAIAPGHSSALFEIRDVYGQSTSFQIEVHVINGGIFITILIVLVLAFFIFLFVRYIQNIPHLCTPMIPIIDVKSEAARKVEYGAGIGTLSVRLSLPLDFLDDIPPKYSFTLPKVQGSRTLQEIIDLNESVSGDYNLAFKSINWFPKNTVIRAASYKLLEVKIPPDCTVIFNGKESEKSTVLFDINGGVEIVITNDYGDYTIKLGRV